MKTSKNYSGDLFSQPEHPFFGGTHLQCWQCWLPHRRTRPTSSSANDNLQFGMSEFIQCQDPSCRNGMFSYVFQSFSRVETPGGQGLPGSISGVVSTSTRPMRREGESLPRHCMLEAHFVKGWEKTTHHRKEPQKVVS